MTVEGDTLLLVGDCEGHLVMAVTLPAEYLDEVKERLADYEYELGRIKQVDGVEILSDAEAMAALQAEHGGFVPRVDCLVYTNSDRWYRQSLEAYLHAAKYADELAEILADDRRYDRTRGASTIVHGDRQLHPWGLVARIYREISIAHLDTGKVDIREIESAVWNEADQFIRAGNKITAIVDAVQKTWLERHKTIDTG